MIRIKPKRLYLCHLAALNELADHPEVALRYYRYLATLNLEADCLVADQDLQALLAGERNLPHPVECSPIELAFRIQVDLAAVYFDMKLHSSAERAISLALNVIPGNPEAMLLQQQIQIAIDKIPK